MSIQDDHTAIRRAVPCTCVDSSFGHRDDCLYRRARLDADKTAYPLTEIVAVLPVGDGQCGIVHLGQSLGYVVRPTEEYGISYFAHDGVATYVVRTRNLRVVADCPTEEAARAALRLMQVGT